MTSTLPAPESDHKFELCPANNHLAICYRVVDLGTHETEFNGQKKLQRKIQLTWETPHELMEDGRPFSISSRRYTWSMYDRAALRQDLESWRGVPFEEKDFGEGGFDIKSILGVPCMLNVIHNQSADKSKTYANVASIANIPKGLDKPAQHNPNCFVWLEKDLFDKNAFDELSEYTQNLIMESPEYKALFETPDSVNQEETTEFDPSNADDVPF